LPCASVKAPKGNGSAPFTSTVAPESAAWVSSVTLSVSVVAGKSVNDTSRVPPSTTTCVEARA
jgi:hypothetical protein